MISRQCCKRVVATIALAVLGAGPLLCAAAPSDPGVHVQRGLNGRELMNVDYETGDSPYFADYNTEDIAIGPSTIAIGPALGPEISPEITIAPDDMPGSEPLSDLPSDLVPGVVVGIPPLGDEPQEADQPRGGLLGGLLGDEPTAADSPLDGATETGLGSGNRTVGSPNGAVSARAAVGTAAAAALGVLFI